MRGNPDELNPEGKSLVFTSKGFRTSDLQHGSPNSHTQTTGPPNSRDSIDSSFQVEPNTPSFNSINFSFLETFLGFIAFLITQLLINSDFGPYDI